MNNEMSDTHKYVSEAVWLPTYIGVSIIVLTSINNSYLATILILVALTGTRILLEILYRFVFDKGRLHFKTGIIAFSCQLAGWLSVLWWYACQNK
ncbi:MAG: hypothetical protein P8Z75_13700 [Gammaproteobacteria bacterium]|jgi:hypothetical protein